MSTARYLVTGGAGFIGSRLADALVSAGERVRVLDNLSTGSWRNLAPRLGDPRLECLEGDVRDAAAVARAAAGVEVVFHLAAIGSVPWSIDDPVGANAHNVSGTVTVLDVARRSGARRVIFASSAAVYGECAVLPAHEGLAPAPLSPYAASKLASEHYARVFHLCYAVETLSLRYFNIFGPGQSPDGPYAAGIPRFVHAAVGGRPITVFGDGEQTRDFCYVANAVAANLAAAQASRPLRGEVVNIGSGERVSVNRVLGELGRVLGAPPAVRHEGPRAGDIRHSVADIGRARELLGYEPAVSWQQGLGPTVEFLRGWSREIRHEGA
ncbi:MAG: NAD-dependent epimerase/dehydratase family protein [Deltaproteobacteria bacterium]|nr:NAD-dependent epimerase/dehydratase family protein [Deltaproteobacteria bacterium]